MYSPMILVNQIITIGSYPTVRWLALVEIHAIDAMLKALVTNKVGKFSSLTNNYTICTESGCGEISGFLKNRHFLVNWLASY
jgi:hypothetical protein